MYYSPRRRRSPRLQTVKQARQNSNSTSTTLLQLWVEHGNIISTRSAILLSQTLSAHNAARAALTSSSLSYLLSPVPVAPTHMPSAAVTPSALARRTELRKLRRQHTDSILHLESLQRKAEEIRTEQLHAEARRVEQLQAEQFQAEQLQAKQHKERERKEKEAAEIAAKQNAAPPAPGVSPTPASATGAVKPLDVPVSQVKKRTTNKDGLHIAIVASGKPVNGPRSDKIELVDGTADDLSEVIQRWNTLCDEAEPFRKDASMKKPRMDIKKQANLLCNQIAASIKHVTAKVKGLCNVLENAARIGGAAGESFAMKEIAMRLVQESDGTVSLNRTAAFAVGGVIVGVAAGARDPGRMTDVILGAFYQHCIYSMPAYGRRKKDEPMEDFRSRIGYKEEETPDSYMERSCGCISLFAAVLQTDCVLGHSWEKIPNPFSLDIGWTWLARIANREQRTITPAITFAFLEIAGYSMSVRYKKQFTKLMAMVQQVVVMKALKAAPKGPTSRMDTMVEEFIADGCAFSEPPKGKTLPEKDFEFA